MRSLLRLVALAAPALLAACGGLAEGPEAAPAPPSTPAPAAAPPAGPALVVQLDEHGEPRGLRHHRRWSAKVGSGAQPEGDAAFRNLAALGYRVVVSVDGARPDLEGAARHGLRYVHVPIGYDGIDESQRLALAKALADAEGPAYFHCHHGKHRGPAAVAVARIAVEGITHEDARMTLETCGTDPKYKGLYAAAATAARVSAEDLARTPAPPSYQAPGDLVAAMVAIDGHFERLGHARGAAWAVPPAHPDVDPPHEARLLWEQYRELARRDEARAHGDRFLTFSAEAEAAAQALETAIRANDAKAAEDAFARSKKACGSCHKAYRD